MDRRDGLRAGLGCFDRIGPRHPGSHPTHPHRGAGTGRVAVLRGGRIAPQPGESRAGNPARFAPERSDGCSRFRNDTPARYSLPGCGNRRPDPATGATAHRPCSRLSATVAFRAPLIGISSRCGRVTPRLTFGIALRTGRNIGDSSVLGGVRLGRHPAEPRVIRRWPRRPSPKRGECRRHPHCWAPGTGCRRSASSRPDRDLPGVAESA